MSMTGEAGGERYEDAGSAPSESGKLGTPAMSVASSTARREVPSVGDAGGGVEVGEEGSNGEDSF